MVELSELKLLPEQLHRPSLHDNFDFQDTSELEAKRTIIGQERGVTAIEFGIEMEIATYNLFVMGPTGSGRIAAVRQFIDERVINDPTPDDWCYIYNFQHPQRPKAIRLPAGKGCELQTDINNLINRLRTDLLELFDTDTYVNARNQIRGNFQQAQQAIFAPVEQLAEEKSFVLQPTEGGALMILPVRDGKPLTPVALQSLSEAERDKFSEGRKELEEAMEKAFRESQAIQAQAQESLEALRQETASQVIDSYMGQVLPKYDLYASVIGYLKAMRTDILDSLSEFQQRGADTQQNPDAPLNRQQVESATSSQRDNRYQVNVLVENEPQASAPVILLDLPTYQNLVGRIEHQVRFGMLSTDFSQIKPGALHVANGGYLIIRALDLLQHPFAWEALKRALNRGEIVIEEPDFGNPTIHSTLQLQPEAIPLNIKVVLVGDTDIYTMLYQRDDNFRELFRVKADFAPTMRRTEKNELAYAQFIATRCHEENLPHFEVDAVRRVVDFGSWLVSDQDKLSTRFGQVMPVIYESAFFAKQNGHKRVAKTDVEQALAASIYRNNQIEEFSQERITRGTIFIDVEGEVIGQINGLVVFAQGDYSFGLPRRLTARVSMGRKDVVQIDRESHMTGPIHDKGVLILQGYLGGRYAQDYPLTLTATLTFEQNYGGVEGDSASSTELYALLSALSNFPIRQDLAVTGSINQHGQIQPIGGATQKVEGFYQTCKVQGLTGTQGVIIPKANVPHLMLNDEVIQAVADGNFHVYAVQTVDEGIALLTGKSADEVHQAVDQRLRYLAETLHKFEDRRSH